jgi:hypothetical protein
MLRVSFKIILMKTQQVLLATSMLVMSLAFSSCEEQPMAELREEHRDVRTMSITQYPLSGVTDPNVSGSVTLKKLGSKTKVVIELTGTMPGQLHPAHIHYNSVAIGGGIAISLAPVNGASGKSTTLVSSLDNGTPISYEALLLFNGYVNVHMSDSDLATIVAQGDIGTNVE